MIELPYGIAENTRRDQELVHKLVPDNLRGLLRELPSLPSQSAILLASRTRRQRQRRATIPAWGNAPGIDPQAKGLKARPNVMPQSLSLTIIHVVFSTKDRRPFLGPDVRLKTHAYLATVSRNLGCEAYRVGGVADHVHMAIRLSRTISIADLVQELKTASSKWLKAQSIDLQAFAWQRGYGCFSVGPSDLDALRAYIDNQEKHHETHTFQDEFRTFLKKYNVEYDEFYVWD